MARLEGAITAIEQRRHADASALRTLQDQQVEDRARLAMIEAAAGDAITAIDNLLAGTV